MESTMYSPSPCDISVGTIYSISKHKLIQRISTAIEEQLGENTGEKNFALVQSSTGRGPITAAQALDCDWSVLL